MVIEDIYIYIYICRCNSFIDNENKMKKNTDKNRFIRFAKSNKNKYKIDNLPNLLING